MSRNVADLLFRPRSVAVVGASSDPAKLSGRPLAYLKTLGYEGQVFAINPRRPSVQGVDTYAQIGDVPGPVDLAIIVLPAQAVVQAVEECAAAGVGAAIIFASGFAEVGSAGREVQDQLRRAADASGMRVLGPNCLGAFSEVTSTFATFSTAFDDVAGDRPVSPIALVSQSGAVGTFTYSTMASAGVGVSYMANTGNQCDITVVEMLTSLVDASDVSVLMGHLEGLDDPSALAELAERADEAGKPLVLLKSGRTDAGVRAVAAHTASIAGDDQLFSDIISEHGAIRVDTMESWADAALAFSDGRQAAGSRVSIVTLSGGAGALAADEAVTLGLKVDTFDDVALLDAISGDLPSFGSVANPFDLTGSMINDVNILRTVLDRVVTSEETDAVLVVLGNAETSAPDVVEVLLESYRATDKPFMVAWTGGSGAPRQALLAGGMPTFTDPSRAVAGLSHVIGRSVRDRRNAAVAGA